MITPVVLVHGGAGVMRSLDGARGAAYRDGLAGAARAGRDVLARGGSALDAVVAAARHMERSGTYNAGAGACLDEDGLASLDALLVRGVDRACGAVGACRATVHPTDVCLDLLNEGRHVLLVGEGADRRAQRLRLPPLAEPDADRLATFRKLAAERGLKPTDLGTVGQPDDASRQRPAGGDGFDDEREPVDRVEHHDTVGAVAVDAQGRTAAAVTTGGLWLKHSGRVGDSAVLGAGAFACDALGAAASATGIGERMIRALTCKLACDLVAQGHPAPEAARLAAKDVHDRYGDASGGLIVVDRVGRIGVAFDTPGMGRAASWVGRDDAPVAVWPDEQLR